MKIKERLKLFRLFCFAEGLWETAVGVRSAHSLPSPNPTLWDYTGYVVIVVFA